MDEKQVYQGHGIIEVDTKICKISEAISYIASQVDIRDISVVSASIDETVVNLYNQYEL